MLTRLIFILTLFGSAFLSFLIQPVLGKMLLPIVGGAAAAWIVAMAFFQIALLGGYTLSHILRRISPLQHGLVLLIIYVCGLYFLPASIPSINVLPDHDMFVGWDVLKILTHAIAIPFIALTATTSSLLRIFSRTHDTTASDPYYLFMASNAGSLIGLFIYPLFLEPRFDLSALSQFWFVGYGLVIAGITVSLIIAWRSNHQTQSALPLAATDISRKDMLLWFCLAFVPCSLSMGVTSLITTDMGSLPLFWVLPLGLYLLSFIFAFMQKPFLKLQDLHFWHICSAGITLLLITQIGLTYAPTFATLIFSLTILLGLFFVVCWSCHQTLAALRPAPDRLTLYYLIIAFGGAVAGIINAFVVPFIFNDAIEFPISIVLSLLLPMIWSKRILPPLPKKYNSVFILITLIGIIALVLRHYAKITPSVSPATLVLVGLVFNICVFILIFKPRLLAVIGAAATIYYTFTPRMGIDLLNHRNFFGTSIVMQFEKGGYVVRGLRHGNTLHGIVRYNPKTSQPVIDMSVGYYSSEGPVQDGYSITQPQKVAILGLGTGQLSCHSRTAKVTYFEIDPDIVTIAKSYFPYLNACPPDNIVIGDARITFSREQQKYDLLILDVFSSDGIPIHILTTEAVAMYREHLTENGLMLFHISNRYLALAAPIAASAEPLGLKAYERVYHPAQNKSQFALSSQWVAVPLRPQDGQTLLQKGWHAVDPGQTAIWTDQRSSLISALRPFNDINLLPQSVNPEIIEKSAKK